MFVRVIGPVEFRKTTYFATWWRLVAREHDFKPKIFNYIKTLKIGPEKIIWDTTANDGNWQPVYWSHDHFRSSGVQFENFSKADK